MVHDGAFANRALAAALERAPQLPPPERGLATELVYGVLRRRARLDRALDAVATRGLSVPEDVRNVLRVGAYQLLFLDRIPAYAAVDDTVETMKREHGARLGGLANALLRRVAERGEPPLPDPTRDPRGYLLDACGFPAWMADLCLRELGAERAVALGVASGEIPPLAIRANPLALVPPATPPQHPDASPTRSATAQAPEVAERGDARSNARVAARESDTVERAGETETPSSRVREWEPGGRASAAVTPSSPAREVLASGRSGVTRAPSSLAREALRAALAAERPGATLSPSPVAPDALLARGLEAPATTAAFARGAFAIEDVGAQVVAELCGAAPGERILDACAGLGGKTAHLAALSGNAAAIDALDLSAAKLRQAEEQWARLGASGITARAVDLTKDFPAGTVPYQRVLLDAPCSGLGVLRRHPEVLLRRTEADVTLLAATQRRMLDVVAPLVAPGGVLVYAVCTFDRAEGEDVVASFLAAHPEFVPAPPPASAIPWQRLAAGAPHLIRLWPDRDDADAFFAARLQRHS